MPVDQQCSAAVVIQLRPRKIENLVTSRSQQRLSCPLSRHSALPNTGTAILSLAIELHDELGFGPNEVTEELAAFNHDSVLHKRHGQAVCTNYPQDASFRHALDLPTHERDDLHRALASLCVRKVLGHHRDSRPSSCLSVIKGGFVAITISIAGSGKHSQY